MNPTNAGGRFALRVLPPLLLVVILIAALQLLADTGVIRHYVLPAPGEVARSLVQDFAVMGNYALCTLRIALPGFLLSALTGTAFALLMDRFILLSHTAYPFIVISQTIPTLVITPVIVLIFGYGDMASLIVVILVCFFPVTINLLQGLRSVDDDLLQMMHTMGASRAAILRHLKFPASLPSFFAGIRISSTYCVMAAVLAEWAGGGEGIGIYMLRMKRSFRYSAMFASILWIIALSLIFYAVALFAERFSMPWRERPAGQTDRRSLS
ncbi:MAG: ABC transporter permease [Clostridiaceae bacterium]|nr:ABC transporter permease [Clostridiaceae bacterium]